MNVIERMRHESADYYEQVEEWEIDIIDEMELEELLEKFQEEELS